MILRREDIEKSTYYTHEDIRPHNNISKLWVILQNKVFDLTSVAQNETDWQSKKNILDWAGKDISHMFKDGRPRINWGIPSSSKNSLLLPGFQQFLPEVYIL